MSKVLTIRNDNKITTSNSAATTQLSKDSISSAQQKTSDCANDENRAPTETCTQQTCSSRTFATQQTENQPTHTHNAPPHGKNYTDIDLPDADNTYMVAQFAKDIYHYLHMLERKSSFQICDYLQGRLVTEAMREVVADWLIAVHMTLKLANETLYLAVQFFDRYLQSKTVPKNKLQLVGVAAMWLAAQYEEVHFPAVDDFLYLCDHIYSANELKNMKADMLQNLNFELFKPISLQFVRRFSKSYTATEKAHNAAKYFCEIALCDFKLAQRRPSEIAAGASRLARELVLNDTTWPDQMLHYTRYCKEDLEDVCSRMKEVVKSSSHRRLHVFKKYSGARFGCISAKILRTLNDLNA